MNSPGSIVQCPVNTLSAGELKSIFDQPYHPIEWKIRTPSKGRAGNGRKNRGRFLPKGKADRYMRRYMDREHKFAAAWNAASLYDFLSRPATPPGSVKSVA